MFTHVRLWLLYLYRLIGSQLIQPITHSSWYTPRMVVAGHSAAIALPVHPPGKPWIDPSVLADVEQYLFHQHTRALLVMQRGQLVHEAYCR